MKLVLDSDEFIEVNHVPGRGLPAAGGQA